MELVDRYVHAVVRRLHPSRRAGVEAELRASIMDALEARGADPTEEQVADVLTSLGEPSELAARYEPSQRYLIGPEHYPLFRRVLGRTLGILGVASAAILVVALILGGSAEFAVGGMAARALLLLAAAAIVATLVQIGVFAWLQRQEGTGAEGDLPAPEEWDPRTLPPVRRDLHPSRSEGVAGIVAGVLALVVAGGIGRAGRAALPTLSPDLVPLVQELVVTNALILQWALLLSVGAHLMILIRDRWITAGMGLRLLADLGAGIVFVRLPFQIMAYREELLDQGMAFTWLLLSAALTGFVVLAMVASFWFRLLRSTGRRERGAGRGIAGAALVAGAFVATLGGLPASAQPGGDPALQGRLHHLEYRSRQFDEIRELRVYTPPGYDLEPERKYPTLYLLHGVGEGPEAWIERGQVDRLLDRLIAEDEALPMVVVMPLGYGLPGGVASSREMLSPATDQREVMERFVAELRGEVMPLVERTFRLRSDVPSRAVAGLSMGGSQALYLGLNHPELFGEAASFGAAVIMFGGRFGAWFPRTAEFPAKPGVIHMSVGTGDFLLGANRHFASWLEGEGLSIRLEEVPGGHDWELWPLELTRALPTFFRPATETSPLAFAGAPSPASGTRGASDPLPDAQEVVDRYLSAIGGRDAVLAHPRSRSVGSYEIPMLGMRGELEVVFEAPNRVVTRITVPGMEPILQGFDGEVGWSVEPMLGARILAGRELDLVRETAHRLARVRDPSLFLSRVTVALTEEDGEPCYQIQLHWASGRESTDCYHLESGLLISTREEVESPMGTAEVVTRFSEYQFLGGILAPARTTIESMGMTQILEIRSVSHEGVDTSLLQLPARIRALAAGR